MSPTFSHPFLKIALLVTCFTLCNKWRIRTATERTEDSRGPQC